MARGQTGKRIASALPVFGAALVVQPPTTSRFQDDSALFAVIMLKNPQMYASSGPLGLALTLLAAVSCGWCWCCCCFCRWQVSRARRLARSNCQHPLVPSGIEDSALGMAFSAVPGALQAPDGRLLEPAGIVDPWSSANSLLQ